MTKIELVLIHQIAKRASDAARMFNLPEYKTIDASMDLLAVHERTPIALHELLVARNEHFLHDVLGIRKHLNRDTRLLEDQWTPRHALSRTSAFG